MTQGKEAFMQGFNYLDLKTKSKILKERAVLVDELDYFNYRVNLYSWNRYFLEEYFEKEEKKVTRIAIATDKDLLKFIRNICISDLGFNCLS
jgi:hypothetical protein